jgi:SAM-dependent methyltransferase
MAETTTKDVSAPAYWEAAYTEGRDGWELGAAAPPLVRALAELRPEARASGAALVLGSGRGHEARAAAAQGWARVVGVDFATAAREEASKLTPPELASRIEWRTRDLFDLPATDAGAFDLVVEHTSFCAIDPARRAEWARVVHAVLRPGGSLLGLFYTHGRPGGPPFGAAVADVLRALEAAGLRVERHEVPVDSIERRRGDELLVWAARPFA